MSNEEIVFEEDEGLRVEVPRPDSNSPTDEIHGHDPIPDPETMAQADATRDAQALVDKTETRVHIAGSAVLTGGAAILGGPVSGILMGALTGLGTGLNSIKSEAEREAQHQQDVRAGAKSGVEDQIEGSDYVPSATETQKRLNAAGITNSDDPRTGNPNPAADDLSGDDGRPKLTTAQKLTSRIGDEVEPAKRELVDVLTLKVRGGPIRG
jgi:hypothetical protein